MKRHQRHTGERSHLYAVIGEVARQVVQLFNGVGIRGGANNALNSMKYKCTKYTCVERVIATAWKYEWHQKGGAIEEKGSPSSADDLEA